jgi:glutamate N-acetyltransferase / amino-acid N-acetyltransferase
LVGFGKTGVELRSLAEFDLPVWPLGDFVSYTALPQGFTAHVANIGIKDATNDFVVIASDSPATGAAVFTQSRFAGPSVNLSRRSVGDGSLRAFVVVSKNANVANGRQGHENAEEIMKSVSTVLGCNPYDILLASTGVIGRQYPMEKIRAHIDALRTPFDGADAYAAAQGIMTTDTVAKVASVSVGDGPARIVGIAKGVGMLEPNMATLIVLFMTDARMSAGELRPMFKAAMDKTFNCLSIDTDTSTSDTAAIMANGAAGFVDRNDFAKALDEVALSLTKQVARDGEGATKLLTVTVDRARDDAQAKRVAKSILNSPLVKTAVHGADPNWGRVAMAIGKCETDTDISPDRVVIRFGSQEVYPAQVGPEGLVALAAYMKGKDVHIHVSLMTGNATSTVYGCDLSREYITINADYTT